MDRSEVEKCVEDFHTFPSEIRDNIPSIVSAAMEVIHLKFQSIKTSRKNSFAASDQIKTEAVGVGLNLIKTILQIKRQINIDNDFVSFCFSSFMS